MIQSTWELLRDSLVWINLPFTVLLGGVVFYWLLVLVGMIDIDLPFIDIGGPEAGDVSVDGVEAGAESEGIIQPLLKFLNVGQAPVMTVVTIIVLSMWVIALLSNRHFNPDNTGLRALLLLLPNLLVSGIITHFAAKPFGKINRYLNTDFDQAPPMVGQIGTVMTSELDSKFGTINVEVKGAPLTLQGRSEEGKVYKQGDRVEIVREDKSSGIYFVVRH
jgi:hypothetical protein